MGRNATEGQRATTTTSGASADQLPQRPRNLRGTTVTVDSRASRVLDPPSFAKQYLGDHGDGPHEPAKRQPQPRIKRNHHQAQPPPSATHHQAQPPPSATTATRGVRGSAPERNDEATWFALSANTGRHRLVEVPGIEPGSFVASSGLLRAQLTLPLLGPPDHVSESG